MHIEVFEALSFRLHSAKHFGLRSPGSGSGFGSGEADGSGFGSGEADGSGFGSEAVDSSDGGGDAGRSGDSASLRLPFAQPPIASESAVASSQPFLITLARSNTGEVDGRRIGTEIHGPLGGRYRGEESHLGRYLVELNSDEPSVIYGFRGDRLALLGRFELETDADVFVRDGELRIENLEEDVVYRVVDL